MGDRLQSRKRQEAAGALDGVNGTEDACQQRLILGVLLELDEFLIQAREVLVTLDQEFANHFLILHGRVLHRATQLPCRALEVTDVKAIGARQGSL